MMEEGAPVDALHQLAGVIPSEDDSEEEEDLHVCGACHAKFSLVQEFVAHKKSCARKRSTRKRRERIAQVPDAALVHDHRLPSFEQQSSAPVATAAEDALSGSAIADGDRELAVVSLLANQLKPSSSICTDALVSKTSEKFELGLSASGGLVLLSSSAGCREDVVVAGNDEEDGDDHGVGVGADLPDDFAFQLKEVGGPSSSSSASPTMGASAVATEVQQEIVAPIPASTTVAVTNEVDTSRKGRKKKSSKKRGRQAEAPTTSALKEEIQQQPQHPPPADATLAAKTPNKKDPQRRHRCPEEGCSFSASYAKDMARHALTHSGEKPFACPHCPKRFSRKDKVAVHVRTHTGDRPFKCRLCDYAASESGSLAKHMRVHTGERPFSCQICTYRARDASQLTVHLRTHTGDCPFICTFDGCSSSFKTKSDLTRHLRVHTNEKPYKCDACSYSSAIKSNLTHHIRKHHKDRPGAAFGCKLCEFKVSDKASLKQHEKDAHTGSLFRCSKCDFSARQEQALASHEKKIHGASASASKQHSCPYCKFTCRWEGALSSHINRKHGRAEASAPLPGATTSRKAILVKSNCQTNFQCMNCEAAFVRKDSLMSHLRQHKREQERAAGTQAIAGAQQQQQQASADGHQTAVLRQQQQQQTPPPALSHGSLQITAVPHHHQQQQQQPPPSSVAQYIKTDPMMGSAVVQYSSATPAPSSHIKPQMVQVNAKELGSARVSTATTQQNLQPLQHQEQQPAQQLIYLSTGSAPNFGVQESQLAQLLPFKVDETVATVVQQQQQQQTSGQTIQYVLADQSALTTHNAEVQIQSVVLDATGATSAASVLNKQ